MTTMGRPRRTTIARTALAATLVVAIVLIVLFALKYIRDRNLQSLSAVESYFVAQTSEPAHGPSLFIQLAGVCDEGNKGIEVLAPQMSRGITHALVPSLFGYRRVQMSPASRKTMIVSWPGFFIRPDAYSNSRPGCIGIDSEVACQDAQCHWAFSRVPGGTA